MRVGALAMLVAACTSTATGGGTSGGPEPAPVVTGASPAAGDYGDTITVTGQHVLRTDVGAYAKTPDGDRVELVTTPNPAAIPQHDPKTNQDIPIPESAPLTFVFPFPAEGAMTLVAPQGEQPIGSFLPSFTPGHGYALDGARVLGAATLGKETAVLLGGLGGASFVVFGDGEPREVKVVGGPAVPDARAAIHVNDAGTIEALLTDAGDVYGLTFDGTKLTATKYDAIAGTLLGIGADDEGLVIVRVLNGNIERLRGAAPTATVAGPPVPMPSTNNGAYEIAVDGSFVYAWGEHGGDVFDDKAVFSMKRLAADAPDFAPSIELERLDDDFKSISAAQSANGFITFDYCALDTDPFASSKNVCSSSTTFDGRSKLDGVGSDGIARMPPSILARLPGGTTLQGDCDGTHLDVRTLAPDGTSSSAAPTLSCSGVSLDALVVGDGGLRVVAEAQQKLWVAKKR
jgi:hypothetical protein